MSSVWNFSVIQEDDEISEGKNVEITCVGILEGVGDEEDE